MSARWQDPTYARREVDQHDTLASVRRWLTGRGDLVFRVVYTAIAVTVVALLLVSAAKADPADSPLCAEKSCTEVQP